MKTKFTQGEWTVEEEKNSISAGTFMQYQN
jgi:hypothetical protein